MRSAELYLTRALLRFREGDLTGAAADLNAVRVRAGLTAIPVSSLTENMIHIERRREMIFEQDRLFYLQAIGRDIPPGDRVGVAPLDWRSNKIAMPIPASETNLNPNAGN
jgi:hypothetical protein